jgi:hypothetical protein
MSNVWKGIRLKKICQKKYVIHQKDMAPISQSAMQPKFVRTIENTRLIRGNLYL